MKLKTNLGKKIDNFFLGVIIICNTAESENVPRPNKMHTKGYDEEG